MKAKTNKVLIHVSHTYQPKNSLQRIMLHKLRENNQVIIPDRSSAKKFLNDLLIEAESECKTRCTPLKFDSFQGISKDQFNYSISGLASIQLLNVYELKNNLAT